MDFSCALGELEDIWAIPDESTDVDSSYVPDQKAANKLKNSPQGWSDFSFEFTIPRIPSPEYELQQHHHEDNDHSIQQHLQLDVDTWEPLGASVDGSIDGSRHSNDTIDTSVDESTEALHGYGLESPYMENGDTLDDLSPQFLPVSVPSSLIEQTPELGNNMIQLPPQQQQMYLEGLALPQGQAAVNLNLHDPNPHYVRTHPIPPQQQQNWRSFARRQSISKMPLAQLYQIMGLPHNHSSAKDREERIMSELQKSGFKIGQQTWIRDTEEPFRRNVIDRIYQQTKEEYGYSKNLLEAIIRRGTYARMQSNLRRKRRHMSRMRRRGLMH